MTRRRQLCDRCGRPGTDHPITLAATTPGAGGRQLVLCPAYVDRAPLWLQALDRLIPPYRHRR